MSLRSELVPAAHDVGLASHKAEQAQMELQAWLSAAVRVSELVKRVGLPFFRSIMNLWIPSGGDVHTISQTCTSAFAGRCWQVQHAKQASCLVQVQVKALEEFECAEVEQQLCEVARPPLDFV